MLGAEGVAYRLQLLGLITGREPVRQGTERDAGLRGLAFGPLVPVDPDLRRPRSIGADLDERRPELLIENVEVVRADAPLVPEEIKRRDPRLLRSVPGAPDPLELLGDDHRDNPEAALALSCLQVRTDVIELAVIPAGAIRRAQPKHRDLAIAREPAGLGPEAITDPAEQRRRRIGCPRCRHRNRTTCPGTCSCGTYAFSSSRSTHSISSAT